MAVTTFHSTGQVQRWLPVVAAGALAAYALKRGLKRRRPAKGTGFIADRGSNTRQKLGGSRGIHVEHYFEHLEPTTERPRFLAECRRCLEPGGVLRIIVPDMRKYVEAYLANDWTMLNEIGCGG